MKFHDKKSKEMFSQLCDNAETVNRLQDEGHIVWVDGKVLENDERFVINKESGKVLLDNGKGCSIDYTSSLIDGTMLMEDGDGITSIKHVSPNDIYEFVSNDVNNRFSDIGETQLVMAQFGEAWFVDIGTNQDLVMAEDVRTPNDGEVFSADLCEMMDQKAENENQHDFASLHLTLKEFIDSIFASERVSEKIIRRLVDVGGLNGLKEYIK